MIILPRVRATTKTRNKRSNTSKKLSKWDKWFLGLAEYVSTASKDPSTKVGAVIIDRKRRIVSVGYNGLPKKVRDTKKRLSNRDFKIKTVVHAELNAILFASRSLDKCTIYTWPFMPCAPCASIIIQSGITRIVSHESDNPRWAADFETAKELFSDAGVKVSFLPIS